MTAPHHLAVSYALERVVHLKPRSVLDFGCRGSLLPGLMRAAGASVVAVDRDPRVGDLQRDAAKKLGVPFDWTAEVGDAQTMAMSGLKFDVVTALWAIQHNSREEQARIAMDLASVLEPGGRLIVVSSFSPGGTWLDSEREDPQVRLGFDDLMNLIVSPIMLSHPGSKFECQFFSYQHGTTVGDWCSSSVACAIAYEVKRGT